MNSRTRWYSAVALQLGPRDVRPAQLQPLPRCSRSPCLSAGRGGCRSSLAVRSLANAQARSVLKDLVGAGRSRARRLRRRSRASSKTCRCASSTAVTRGSTGSPPRSRLQAIAHAAEIALERPRRNIAPGSAIAIGDARVGAGDRASAAARHRRTVRAIGPSTVSDDHGRARRPGRHAARRRRGSRPHCRSWPGCAASRPCRCRRRSASCRRPAPPPRRRCCRRRSCVEIVRVERRAEHRVEGLRAGAELGRVGLADGDRAGLLQPLDDQRVVGRARSRGRSASRRWCGCPWSAPDP